MNGLKCFALSVALVAAPAVASAQTVLTFDDRASNTVTPIENGYQGLNWDGFYVVDGTNYGGTGYYYGVVSNPNVAYNGWANTADFWSDNPFTVSSLYVANAWVDQANQTFNGYVHGNPNPVYTFTGLFSDRAPTFLSLNWSDINKFEVVGNQYSEHVVLDNITLNGTVTPEPATLLLLGTGLLGMFAAAGALRRTVV